MRGFVLILLFTGIFYYGSANTVEVLGTGECVDCKENNIETTNALLGLKVTIDCKVENGKFQTKGVGKLNKEGDFKVSLPQEIMKDGKLAEECYVQLHNAENAPCGVQNGLEASKITLLSKSNQKHTFGPTEKVKFSSEICTSVTLKNPFSKPSFPKAHHLFKKFGHFPPLPHKVLPPFPLPPKIPFKKPCSPPPVKPTPAPVPEPKPEPKPEPTPEPKPEPAPKPTPKPTPKPAPKPTPEPKPCPPHIPFLKPHPQILPPPFPIYKPHPKILPPSIPIYKPLPKILPPPFPTYKPHPKILPPPTPIFKPHPKILPPSIPIYKPHPKILSPLSPFHKKPCPPIGFPKLPPLPTIPPKYFHHPIIPVPPHH